MIQINKLSKSYEKNKILNSIDLEIGTGEIFALVGSSGAGKSTLLNCINGLETYEEGSINVDGTKIETLNEKQIRLFRKNTGMIFQNSALIERKNVYKNIAFPMECWRASKEEIKSRVYNLAELVGIQDKLQNRPDELSGGQRQRVAIARALALNPKYLLSDESTSALDPNITKSILKLIRDIRKEFDVTVIMVTHEMQVVQGICEKMAILENGKISASGKVTDLFLQKPQSLKKLLGEEEVELSKTGINLSYRLCGKKNDMHVIYDLSKIVSKPINLIDTRYYNMGVEKICDTSINISRCDLSTVEKYFLTNDIKFEQL
ncbi:MAG: methionine ABC transporter ATP-binding protein [Clostridioides sp.]|jgi:D-methionine transport system ATP-binding protein|nr:methionine ABC transporter ATP-binding protein [Clostridioides sp.]